MTDPDPLRGKHLHFDCASGAAGDMMLGALLHLGVPVSHVRAALDQVGIGGWRLDAQKILKRGIGAINVTVNCAESSDQNPASGNQQPATSGHHHHDHHHHAHRHWSDIRSMIEEAPLDTDVRHRAMDIFSRIARAEAKIHGVTIDRVAFHEVGAVDSIVDIVGTAAALAYLAPASVSAATVAVGHGTVHCAHGTLPVPAPATVEILREGGCVVIDGGVDHELCTPTGAAILAATVTDWAPMPPGTPLAIGYGAGDRDLSDRANVMRAVVTSRPAKASGGSVLRLEANIDDMSPELCEHAAERLFEAGALDVWWTPITMKKSRPAVLLTALVPESVLEAAVSVVLRETTSIGVRVGEVSRRVLERRIAQVSTRFGSLPIKLAVLGGEVVNVAPEYEPCRAAARTHGVALKLVYAEVQNAWHRESGK